MHPLLRFHPHDQRLSMNLSALIFSAAAQESLRAVAPHLPSKAAACCRNSCRYQHCIACVHPCASVFISGIFRLQRAASAWLLLLASMPTVPLTSSTPARPSPCNYLWLPQCGYTCQAVDLAPLQLIHRCRIVPRPAPAACAAAAGCVAGLLLCAASKLTFSAGAAAE